MLRAELVLLFRRRRTLVLLGVLALLPILAGLALRFFGSPHGGGGGGPAFFNQVTNNGVFLSLAALTVASGFFLPLTVSIVGGDTIAGEAGLGTLRYLLVRPVGRTRLLAAKLASALAYCLVAAIDIAVVGLIAGSILFPVGSLTTISGFQISLVDGIGRALLAAVVLGVSMFGVAAIGLFVSTLTETPVGAMAGTAGFFIASLVIGGISQLSFLHPYLFTEHWDAFADLFRVPISWGGIVSDLELQLGWGLVAVLAAWARFTTSDVLA